MTAFQTYLGLANPDPVTPDVHYFEFQHGDAAFFVWDTRSYRSANHAVDDEEKTMLGEQQKTVFFDWLARVRSSSPPPHLAFITWEREFADTFRDRSTKQSHGNLSCPPSR